MAELRWHPLIGDWVMIASHRQARPQNAQRLVSLLPGLGQGTGALSRSTNTTTISRRSRRTRRRPTTWPPTFSRRREPTASARSSSTPRAHHHAARAVATGMCAKLVDLWCERFEALRSGREDQVCALSLKTAATWSGSPCRIRTVRFTATRFVPEKAASLKLANAAETISRSTRHCLFCDMLKNELPTSKTDHLSQRTLYRLSALLHGVPLRGLYHP